jgi:hypothetical protein
MATVFISDRSNPLSEALINEALKGGHQVFTTVADGKIIREQNVTEIPFNPRSSLSARSLLLKIQKETQQIDHCIFIHSPKGSNAAYHDMPVGILDEETDVQIRGMLYLSREMIGQLMRQGSGIATFVLSLDGAEILTPLASCALGAVETLASSLFMQYSSEPLLLNGFCSRSTKLDAFAKFIHRNCWNKPEKTKGRWHLYGGKRFLLSRSPWSR